MDFKYNVLMMFIHSYDHHISNPQSNAISATINIVKPFEQYSEAIIIILCAVFCTDAHCNYLIIINCLVLSLCCVLQVYHNGFEDS